MILCVCPNPSVDTSWTLEGGNIHPGSVTRITAVQRYPGGKATHTALALQEMGAPVLLMGIWAGENGRFIQAACHRYGLKTAGINLQQQSPDQYTAQNRSCYTVNGSNSSSNSNSNSNSSFSSSSFPDTQWNNTELLEPGPALSYADYSRFLEAYKDIINKKEIDQVVLAGSWPDLTGSGGQHPFTPGIQNKDIKDIQKKQQPGQVIAEDKKAEQSCLYEFDPYGPFIEAANLHGIKVWLDCAGDHLSAALGGMPSALLETSPLISPDRHLYGIHINEAELEGLAALTAVKSNGHQPVLALLRKKSSLLALTKGADGLFLYQGAERGVHSAVDVEKVLDSHQPPGKTYSTYSTVGCGDCLVAGLVFASAMKQSAELVADREKATGTEPLKNREKKQVAKEADIDIVINDDINMINMEEAKTEVTRKERAFLPLSLQQLAKYGAAAGAANILRKETGMLYRADMAILLKHTRTKILQ